MNPETYEIFAIRYGTLMRQSSQNFLGGDSHDASMPLDYFVWVVVGDRKSWIVDTGFGQSVGVRRGRQVGRPVGDGLRELGIDPETVEDVIVTHMHYDHAGNHGLFPRATFHLQASEMQYCTGCCMLHPALRHSYEAEDVGHMVRRLYEGKLCFHDGVGELAPGLSLHLVGGHTRGMQVVRVHTARGWVVLASDAMHYYANKDRHLPFPSMDSVSQALDAWRTIERLADSPAHVIPGHDPLVVQRYPLVRPGIEGIVRLDVAPVR